MVCQSAILDFSKLLYIGFLVLKLTFDAFLGGHQGFVPFLATVVDFGQGAAVVFGQMGWAHVLVQFLHFVTVEVHLQSNARDIICIKI